MMIRPIKRLWFGIVGGNHFAFIKAEPPCWKGEVTIPLLSKFNLAVIIGWENNHD